LAKTNLACHLACPTQACAEVSPALSNSFEGGPVLRNLGERGLAAPKPLGEGGPTPPPSHPFRRMSAHPSARKRNQDEKYLTRKRTKPFLYWQNQQKKPKK
jgi:hypothetical protein